METLENVEQWMTTKVKGGDSGMGMFAKAYLTDPLRNLAHIEDQYTYAVAVEIGQGYINIIRKRLDTDPSLKDNGSPASKAVVLDIYSDATKRLIELAMSIDNLSTSVGRNLINRERVSFYAEVVDMIRNGSYLGA